MKEYMMPCLTKKFLGFECFGCGIQRSLVLILEGDFLGAFYMYPAIYVIIIFFGFVLINLFKSFKYANKLINSFGILTVIIIITNFLIKLLN
jgi:hypothetical protein